VAAIADDRFSEILQCVAALHSAGLGDGEETGRSHLPLGTAIAKDDFAQLHGNAQGLFHAIIGGLHAGMLDESEQPAAVLEQGGGHVAHFFVITVQVLPGEGCTPSECECFGWPDFFDCSYGYYSRKIEAWQLLLLPMSRARFANWRQS
jgi:hypothetical protein